MCITISRWLQNWGRSKKRVYPYMILRRPFFLMIELIYLGFVWFVHRLRFIWLKSWEKQRKQVALTPAGEQDLDSYRSIRKHWRKNLMESMEVSVYSDFLDRSLFFFTIPIIDRRLGLSSSDPNWHNFAYLCFQTKIQILFPYPQA